MAEPTIASYPSAFPLGALVNQKILSVSGTHNASVTTITTSATITDITAPVYLVNATTGEIIYVEQIDNTQLKQVTRGADGSTAEAMAGGQLLHVGMVANIHNQLIREVNAMISATSAIEEPVLASQVFG